MLSQEEILNLLKHEVVPSLGCVEETIANTGKVSMLGMITKDKIILDIMMEKKNDG